MTNETDNIISFYGKNPDKEWNRLEGRYSDIEKEIVHRTIDKYINNKATILDLGCGPGRYAVDLAKKGHKVFLVDIVQSNLDYAIKEFRKNDVEDKLIGVECAPAQSFITNLKFDAVLAFGPFYHIINEDEIKSTLENIKTMIKDTGYIFIIFIQMISIFKDFLKRGWINETKMIIKEKYTETGIFHPLNEKQIEEYMPDFKAYRYNDAKKMLENAKLEVKEILTCESFAAFMRPYFEMLELSNEQYNILLDLLYEMAGQDFILNSTDHYLTVSRI